MTRFGSSVATRRVPRPSKWPSRCPMLLLFVYGIFQFGVILQANAGMQHALGEGARLATLYSRSRPIA